MSQLVVKKLTGFASVQDLGRIGYASHAVPRGGALCRGLVRRANRSLGNDEGAACIEVFGRIVVAATSELEVATDDARPVALNPGDELVIDPDAHLRARYLAIAGGVDAPVVLGSRSTLASCFGDALVVGTHIASAGASRGAPAVVPLGDLHAPIAVVGGPDEPLALTSLLSRAWRIGAASNRVGTRLAGPPLGATSELVASSPTAIGAIQLPSGGGPIVIGPDGPTTGGYPIIGVIAHAHVDRFHALPLGARVSFVGTR